MQYRQRQLGQLLVLLRRPYPQTPMTQRHGRLVRMAPTITKEHPVQALDRRVGHLLFHCLLAVTCRAIRAGAHQEMCAQLPGRVKQRVDVAFAVRDVHASPGLRLQQRRGLLQPLDPAMTFPVLDTLARGPACCLILAEFLPVPELQRTQPQGQRILRDGQTRVHQHPADPRLLLGSRQPAQKTHILWIQPIKRERGCIVQHQNLPLALLHATPCGLQVPRNDRLDVHPIIGQHPVRCFRRSPILERGRNRVGHILAEMTHDLAQACLQTRIRHLRATDLFVNPLGTQILHFNLCPICLAHCSVLRFGFASFSSSELWAILSCHVDFIEKVVGNHKVMVP